MKHISGRYFLLSIACSFALLGVRDAVADSKACRESIARTVDADPSIGPHDFEIICRQGEVILRGTVASQDSRARVVDIAARTEGVDEITNYLTVNQTGMPAAVAARTDEEVAADVRAALAADDQQLAGKVDVTVVNGKAVLSGNMQNFKEADQALSTALMVQGVRDIGSELTIKGRHYNATVTR